MQRRIYGEKAEIDPDKVNTFFESRFSQDNPLASVMLRPLSGDAVAEARNEREARLVKAFLSGRKDLAVLDLGCGLGRWVTNLEDCMGSYAGADFTRTYIEAARNLHAGKKGVSFYHCSAVAPDPMLLAKQYDLVIINGLCPYLNDADVDRMASYIEGLLTPEGTIYFRESVSIMNERLTLKDFYSEELQSEYSAIYRTPEEYEAAFQSRLPRCRISASGFLLDESTGARAETNQKYWFLRIV